MSTITDLINDLAAAGVTLEARTGKLRFSPRDAVTPGLLGRLRANKAELLAILITTVRCPWCGSVDLVDGQRGVWCLGCERLAWLKTREGGAVRADQVCTERFDQTEVHYVAARAATVARAEQGRGSF